jgi:hypothetical protein
MSTTEQPSANWTVVQLRAWLGEHGVPPLELKKSKSVLLELAASVAAEENDATSNVMKGGAAMDEPARHAAPGWSGEMRRRVLDEPPLVLSNMSRGGRVNVKSPAAADPHEHGRQPSATTDSSSSHCGTISAVALVLLFLFYYFSAAGPSHASDRVAKINAAPAAAPSATTATTPPTIAPPPPPPPPPVHISDLVDALFDQLADRHASFFAHTLRAQSSVRFAVAEQMRRIEESSSSSPDSSATTSSDSAALPPKILVLTIAAPIAASETRAFSDDLARALAALLQPRPLPSSAPRGSARAAAPRVLPVRTGSQALVHPRALHEAILAELRDSSADHVRRQQDKQAPRPSAADAAVVWLHPALNSPALPFGLAHALWSVCDEERQPYSSSVLLLHVDWPALNATAEMASSNGVSLGAQAARVKTSVGDAIQSVWLAQLAATRGASGVSAAAAAGADDDVVPALRSRLVQHVLYAATASPA